MKSPAPGPVLPGGTVVAAAASDLPAAVSAIAGGAGLIDLWDAGRQTVTEVRRRYPRVLACAQADWAGLVRDPAAARRTGALLICAGPAAAAGAEAGGIGRGRILVEAGPARAASLIAAGWQVIVRADEVAGPHASAAVAALSCWLGAAAVRSRYVAAARRAIDMAGSISGTRPVPDGYARL